MCPNGQIKMHELPLKVLPQNIIDQYNPNNKERNGFIYFEICRSIYGLTQSGRLANEYLRKKLDPAGFYEVPHTPDLWKHISCPVIFSFIVDCFGINYVGKEHTNHLIQSLKK